MPWGKVTITFSATGYTQNYKRNNVATHVQCRAMVTDAVADSVALITNATPPAGGLPVPVQVGRTGIAQALPADPGENYRVI